MRRRWIVAVLALCAVAATFDYVVTPRVLMGPWSLLHDDSGSGPILRITGEGTRGVETYFECNYVSGMCSAPLSAGTSNDPAGLTGSVNNWAGPCGVQWAQRITSDGAYDVSGIETGSPSCLAVPDGRRIYLLNVSAFTITLLNDSGSSDPENRMLLGGADVPLATNQGVELFYDLDSQKWRRIQ